MLLINRKNGIRPPLRYIVMSMYVRIVLLPIRCLFDAPYAKHAVKNTLVNDPMTVLATEM